MLIDQLTVAEMLDLHNQLSKTAIKKRMDRKNLEQRLLNISEGKSRDQMLTAAREAKVRDVILRQWTYLKGPDVALDYEEQVKKVPEGKSSKVKAKQSTVKKKKDSKAIPPKKKAGKTKAAQQSEADIDVPEVPDVPEAEQVEAEGAAGGHCAVAAKAVPVLKAIREMIPEHLTGEAAVATSADIAKKLNTSVGFVIAQCDYLDKKNYIAIEDDSPDDDHKFYYVSITKSGRETDLSGAGSVRVAKPRVPGSNPGPRSNYSGKKLFKKVDKNPRREGTCGYKSFALIKDGMTYEAYRSAGGRNNDLQWDLDRGWVELR